MRRVITVGYYSPAEILLHVLLFIPCRPRLPARAFFVHKKAPPERGWRVALCAIAWCRVPPGEFSPVPLNPRHSRFDNQRLYRHQSPLRSGGFTMQFFLTNSHPGRQHSTDLIVRYVTFPLNGYKKSQPPGEAGKLVEQNAVTQTSLQGYPAILKIYNI